MSFPAGKRLLAENEAKCLNEKSFSCFFAIMTLIWMLGVIGFVVQTKDEPEDWRPSTSAVASEEKELKSAGGKMSKLQEKYYQIKTQMEEQEDILENLAENLAALKQKK